MSSEKKVPQVNDKGTREQLMHTAVDPSDVDDDPTSPTLGQPRFLSWEPYIDDNGNQGWRAVGKDKKEYRIEVDEPPKPPKQYKVASITQLPDVVPFEVKGKKK